MIQDLDIDSHADAILSFDPGVQVQHLGNLTVRIGTICGNPAVSVWDERKGCGTLTQGW